MTLGLSSYTYGWAVGVRAHLPRKVLDEHGLLDHVRAHGLKLLQIGDNLALENFAGSRLASLRDTATRDGIQLEVGARRLTLERISRYAEIARSLGAKLIRFVIDDHDFHPAPDEVINTLKKAVPLLAGLTLGLENHDRFKAAEFRHIVESVESERVGICLDTANSLGAGEGIETVVANLAPLTVNLHIKDFTVKRLPHLMGFTVNGCPAGTGLLDIPRLLNVLRQHRRCRTAVLEQWTPPEENIEQTIFSERESAAASLKYLKPLFV